MATKEEIKNAKANIKLMLTMYGEIGRCTKTYSDAMKIIKLNKIK